MRIASFLAFISLAGLTYAFTNTRDYTNNDYYVLHLDPSAPPEEVVSRLGLAHEGQLGVLEFHHIFRARKADHDIVKRAVGDHKRRKRDISGGSDPIDGILLSKKQQVRKHLEKRVIFPPPRDYSMAHPAGFDDTRDFTIRNETLQYQEKLEKELNTTDPIFTEQWHLFNPVQLGQDINVTGLRLEDITVPIDAVN
ncbi:hypothetical protein QWA68_016506 [Fusarium oxysporum]|nr:hypothetical protein QWA68_016506 [Fusarium oxysporum]